MEDVKTIVSDILITIKDIANTAGDVNKNSIIRKDLTSKSLEVLKSLSDSNLVMKERFDKMKSNLDVSLDSVKQDTEDIKENAMILSGITENLNYIKIDLGSIENEIVKLTKIVDEIKSDTDDIFTLALNASIVSSKYSNTSGVFDILANKLNEMSNFITQNLESIVQVVQPITEGIQKLITENEVVLKDIEKGNKTFLELPDSLNKQKSTLEDLVAMGDESANKIENQKKMLMDVRGQIEQMDRDAQGSISGSANVRSDAENLVNEVAASLNQQLINKNSINTVNFVKDKARQIWTNAQNVNEKSRSQLKFTEECLTFTGKIVEESESLKLNAEIFNNQSEDNNEISKQISTGLVELNSHLKEIESKILDSNKTIQTFNDDYKKIDNILAFLKNILKSMHLIGMYSRIESARDIEQFEGFMNISANITKLQKEIQNNIPLIEKNIGDTHALIDAVNSAFRKISSDFFTISESSNQIIGQLNEIIEISSDSQQVSQSVLEISKEINSYLDNLNGYMNRIPEVVKNPIEGSELNISRGKKVEEECIKLKNILTTEESISDQEDIEAKDESTEAIV